MIRLGGLVLLSLALAACGGSSDEPAPNSTVQLSGIVTFDWVPVVPGRGLDYGSTVSRPARGVTVELVRNATVAASTTTDPTGRYTFNVEQNADVSLRVRAEMLRVGTPSWDFRVVDNVNGDALYTLVGTAFNTGNAAMTRNLHAASGWGGTAYTATRSAAPFAILDVVYDATQLVLTAGPSTSFPALKLHWSTQNVPVEGTAPGEIGSTRYRPGVGIFLVGAANQDTDEYDRHVIAHEFGHYLEHRFSRTDSIGGPHTITDQLDMRLAFGEAWGNAFAAMATGQQVYTDAFGTGQSQSFSFDLEQRSTRVNPNPGWFNEESLQSLLYDLYDSGADTPPGTTTVDTLALGFGPMWAALTGPHRATRALITVFPLVHALRTTRPADGPLIDLLTTSQSIATVTDEYGTGQTNFGIPRPPRTQAQVLADFHTVYDSLTVNGPAVNVCSLTDFTSPLSGAENKLASRRFVRFAVATPGEHAITVRALAPLNAAADPDVRLHIGAGQVLVSEEPKPPLCVTNSPQECVETFNPILPAGEHVLEVYEWTNTNSLSDPEPPIGRTCFAVTVTR
jgi:hypothetical protein